MADPHHPYVGGTRPIDDDRVRRLVVDAVPAPLTEADVAAEYEAVEEAPRRGDNAEPVELIEYGPGGE